VQDMCSRCGRRLRTKKNYIDDTMCVGQIVFFKNKLGAIDKGFLALIKDKSVLSVKGCEKYDDLAENQVLVRSKEQNHEKYDQVCAIDDISSSILTVRVERRTSASFSPVVPPSSSKKLSKSQVKRAKKKAKINATKAAIENAKCVATEIQDELAEIEIEVTRSPSPQKSRTTTPQQKFPQKQSQSSAVKTKLSPTKSVGRSAKKLTPKTTPKKVGGISIDKAIKTKESIFSPTRPSSPTKSPNVSENTEQQTAAQSKTRRYCSIS